MNIATVQLNSLISDEAFHPRIGIDEDHVAQMVDSLVKDSTVLDEKRICIWIVGGEYYIVDGHHRYRAYRQLDESARIEVELHETIRDANISDDEYLRQCRSDALQHAIKANNHHGSPLRRSRADNQRAIHLLLNNEITRRLTDSELARIVGVSAPTIAAIRKSDPAFQVDQRVTADGKKISASKQASGAGKRRKDETKSQLAPNTPDSEIAEEEPVDFDHEATAISPDSDRPEPESEPEDPYYYRDESEPEYDFNDEFETTIKIQFPKNASDEDILEMLKDEFGLKRLESIFTLFKRRYIRTSFIPKSKQLR